MVINRYLNRVRTQDGSKNKDDDSGPSVWEVGLIMIIERGHHRSIKAEACQGKSLDAWQGTDTNNTNPYTNHT
jgi:hypothetical protein